MLSAMVIKLQVMGGLKIKYNETNPLIKQQCEEITLYVRCYLITN